MSDKQCDDELQDELDRAFLDIAKSAARRTLELIDQNKVPGYRRCTGYEDGNPERRDMGPLGGAGGNLLTTEGMNNLIGRGLSDLVGHTQSLDVESWMIYVGAALGLIPKGLRDWKALIYESPAVSAALHDIVQKMIELRILVVNGSDASEKVYRLPDPLDRWEAQRPDAEGGRQLVTGWDIGPDLRHDGSVHVYIGADGQRKLAPAVPAYPIRRCPPIRSPRGRAAKQTVYDKPPSCPSVAAAREAMVERLTTGPNSVPRALLDGPLKKLLSETLGGVCGSRPSPREQIEALGYDVDKEIEACQRAHEAMQGRDRQDAEAVGISKESLNSVPRDVLGGPLTGRALTRDIKATFGACLAPPSAFKSLSEVSAACKERQELEELLAALRACFSSPSTPAPTLREMARHLREMAEHLRDLPLGARP